MGVYIENMEMPKEGSWKTVRIYPDGTCAVPNWQGDCTFIKGAQAVPVPPHGRLGDLDMLENALVEIAKKYTRSSVEFYCISQFRGMLIDAPTIIPAEED